MSSNCATCPSRGSCDSKDDEDSCSTGTCTGGVRLPPGITTVYDLEKDVERGSMVWVEVEGSGDEARASPGSLEAISKAASLWDERVFVVMMGPGGYRRLTEEMFELGADTVYHVRGRGVEDFNALAYARTIAEIVERVKPAAFLCAATARGRELAPCLSAILDAGLASDCVGMEPMAGHRLQMLRPSPDGRALSEVFCGSLPQVATLRPGAFPLPSRQRGRKGTVLTWNGRPPAAGLELLSKTPKARRWWESDLLVSLGAGMCEDEDVAAAKELAGLLGGELACSRSAAATGRLPADRQVGEGGRPVSPRVYLAFGISGSEAHMAGLAGVGMLVAVNSDPEAPIHSMAHISVPADGRAVMRALLERLR